MAETFTIREIAAATGKTTTQLRSAYKARQKRGLLPEGLKTFDYTQVKALVQPMPKGERDLNPESVNRLKLALRNDGYTFQHK